MKTDVSHALTVEKKPGSLVEITGELPFSELEKHRATAVTALAKEITLDGFRKGHIPEAVLIKTIGEMPLITEMAERALSHHYPTFVETHGLDVIGYPNIAITKIAKDNPLGFKITVAVVPEVTLPDYKKIVQKINTAKESKEVTEEEVEDQIKEIMRQKAAYERLQKKAGEKEHVHGENCDHKVNAEGREGTLGYEHEHEHEHGEPVEDIKDLPVPELTDEYVKALGKPGQFESVADFKNKIKEHLTIQKAEEVDSRHRAKLTDAIIAEAQMEVPQILIDTEIKQMFAQMEEDLTRAQLKIEDYLAHIKKSKEDLIKEWTPSAEKRAKLQLVLNAIAKAEQINPEANIVDEQVGVLLERYKDADEKRVRVYVTSVLQNDAVMKMLETAA